MKYLKLYEEIDFDEDDFEWMEEESLKIGDIVKFNHDGPEYWAEGRFHKIHPFNDKKAIITEVSDKDGYQVVRLKRVGAKKEEWPWWKADTLEKIPLNENIDFDEDDLEWEEENLDLDDYKDIIPKLFYEFLKENNCLEGWISNFINPIFGVGYRKKFNYLTDMELFLNRLKIGKRSGINNTNDYIGHAFRWRETPEGYKYWDIIHKKFLEYRNMRNSNFNYFWK